MKNWIVPGIILLGVLIIIFSLVAPVKTFTFFDKKYIATVAGLTGSANAQGLDQIDASSLKKDSKIKNLDIIKTDASSEVIIVLEDTGGEFRLTEKSEALIELLDSGSILITVRQGDLLVDQFGRQPSFWIRKEGRQLTAMDYALSYDKNSELFKKQGKSFFTETTTLSQSKIEEIISAKKTDFFRCYGQLIQKQEQAHGQVVISFEISSIGKVVKVDITKSDLQDTAFKACISEVVARTSFPRFSGDNITTVFPLKFE